jgi:hypothetical protein
MLFCAYNYISQQENKYGESHTVIVVPGITFQMQTKTGI